MRTSFAVAAGLAAVATAADVTITSCSPTHTNCPYKPESGHWEDWTTSTPVDPTTTSSSTASWEDWSSTATSSPPVKVTSTSSSSYDPSHTWADWESSSSSSYDPSHTWADWESSSSSSAPAVSTTSSSYDPSQTWADWESYSSSSSSSTPAVVTSTSSCPMYTATAPPAWFSYLPSEAKSSIAAKWTGAPPADWCYYTYSTSTPVASSTPVYSKPVSPASSTPAASSAVWSAYSASPVSPTIAAYTGAASSNTGNIVVAGLAAVAAMVIA